MRKQILILIPSIYLFQKYLYSIGIVKGTSMQPILNPTNSTSNDVVLLSRRFTLKHGDIVFIKNPYKDEQVFVKRVVALEGDYMSTQIPFNESQMQVIEYDLINKPKPQDHAWIEIPAGHVWIESDSNGKDSRKMGPIPMGLILGKAEYILWPWNRISSLSVPNISRAELESRLLRKREFIF